MKNVCFMILQASLLCSVGASDTVELYEHERLIEFGMEGIKSLPSKKKVPVIEFLSGVAYAGVNLRTMKPANEKERDRDAKYKEDKKLPKRIMEEMFLKLKSLPKERYITSKYTHKNGQTLKYLLLFPQNYDKSKKYPLILYLHGGGGSAKENLLEVAGNGVGPAIAACFLGKKYESFILVPQAHPKTGWGTPATHPRIAQKTTNHSEAVIGLVAHIQGRYNTDKDRLYMIGQSMGGNGAIYLSVRYPNLFAASMPIVGFSDPAMADKLDHAMWIFSAEYDKLKEGKPNLAFEFFKNARKAGKNIQFTLFGNSGHLSHHIPYLRLTVWDWLFAQKRGR